MIYGDGGVGMLYAVHVALKGKEGWHYWGMIERVRTTEREDRRNG